MNIENPPAFPRTGEGFGNPLYDSPGMTLRDWFAGQALAGMFANEALVKSAEGNADMVLAAFSATDAALIERGRR